MQCDPIFPSATFGLTPMRREPEDCARREERVEDVTRDSLMFRVPAVSRDEIDQWPIGQSGLPVRVVHCTTAAGVRTVGDLRTWSDERLMELRSFGAQSLKATRSFYKILRNIEMGELRFDGAPRAISSQLIPVQWQVVDLRYGLHGWGAPDTPATYTLQEIANQRGVTRERIRQTEEEALNRLRSRLATVCLSPVTDAIRRFAGEAGGARPEVDLAGWPERAEYAGDLDPIALARLLSELHPSLLSRRHGCICDAPQSALDPAMDEAEACVCRAAGSVGLDEVADLLKRRRRAETQGLRRRGVATLLAHAPALIATCDNRFACRATLDSILCSIPSPGGNGLHYLQWLEEFNRRVHPASQMTGGSMLAHLSGSPRFEREGRGVYRAVPAGRALTSVAGQATGAPGG